MLNWLLRKKGFFIILLSLFFYIGLTLAADINKISSHFLNVKLELIVVVLFIVIISLILRVFRQQMFLQKIEVNISFKDNIKIYLAGLSLVSTPGGIGMAIKSQILKKKFGIARSKTLPIIFIERFHDMLAVLSILVFTLSISYLWQVIVIVIIFSIMLFFLFLIIQNKFLLNKFQTLLLKIKFINKLVPSQELNESFYMLSQPKIVVLGWLISFLSWIIEAFGVYIVFLAFNYDSSFIQIMQYYFTSLSYGAISFIPGGIGVTEGSFISLLVLNGFEFSIASAIVLFIRFTTIWYATLIGFFTVRYYFTRENQTNISDNATLP